MIVISCILFYLAIVKKFEPLLLLPIAFGMLLTNLPGAGLYHPELFEGGHVHWENFSISNNVGLLDYLYLGVKLGIYPWYYFYRCRSNDRFWSAVGKPQSFLLEQLPNLEFLQHSWEPLPSVLPMQKQALSVLSVVLTVLQPFT